MPKGRVVPGGQYRPGGATQAPEQEGEVEFRPPKAGDPTGRPYRPPGQVSHWAKGRAREAVFRG